MGIAESIERIKNHIEKRNELSKGDTEQSTKHRCSSGYSCDKCRDTTWIIINGAARRCGCYELNRVKCLWESSGVNIDGVL